MAMSEVGAGWWRQRLDRDKRPILDKENKEIWNISFSIHLPFLGEASFMLVPIPKEEIRNDKMPQWRVLYMPPINRTQSGPSSSAPGGPPSGGEYEGGGDEGGTY